MEIPPIHTLPDEVLGKIFSHLSQRDILRCVLPVCRRWQAVAQSQVLSRGLAFCCYNNHYQPVCNDYQNHHHHDDPVPTEEALRLIQAIPNLKSLKLRRRSDALQLLQAVRRSCLELRRLDIGYCWNKDSALTAALLALFRSCYEHLTDLTLCWVRIANGLPFCQELCTAMPNLRRLTIDCDWFGSAELDAVIDGCNQMQAFCIACPCSDAQIIRMAERWGSSLQVLEMDGFELTGAGLATLAGFSQLKNLLLYSLRSPGVGLLQLASLVQLEQFSLLLSDDVQPENVRQFFSQSRSASRLRNIGLPTCLGVDDGVLTALAAACPRVESVDVADCERVTAAGVRALLRGCRRLLQLNVSGTDDGVGQILPEIPQLAPQLRRLIIDCASQRPFPELVCSVEAQMPGLKLH